MAADRGRAAWPGGIDAALTEAGLDPLPRTAWVEVDLDALAGNVSVIRRLAGDGVAIHPVVKADAYGHGAIPIARRLQDLGVDGLCVATFDEARALRRAGIELPLQVLYPIPPAWASAAAADGVAVTAGDPTLLGATLEALDRTGPGPSLHLELEVETGLGRGGFLVHDVVAAASRIRAAERADLAGVWTHLQAPEDATVTAGQLDRFEAALRALTAGGVLPARWHLRASGSILTATALAVTAADGFGAGAVRPGLSTYGLIPDELLDDGGAGAAAGEEAGVGARDTARPRLDARAAGLRPVLALRARPVRVAELPPGWGIGYGPTFRTSRPSRIATLPLGYGDGWPRALSNRAAALVRGRRVPLVGNVAMDAVMADVTDVPGSPVGPHDVFTLIGDDGPASITAHEVAIARGTNVWEVVTAMAGRLPRVYHAASGPVGVRTLVVEGDG